MDSSAGILRITTLRKLPTIAPNQNAVIAQNVSGFNRSALPEVV
jgi:hypothetical protein